MISEPIDEAERIAREIAADDYKAEIDEVRERTRYQVEYSQALLRNLQLVNGGGVIALLTFIGNSDANFYFRGIWWSFLWFASGLFVALISYFCAFYTQLFFQQQTFKQAWNAQLRSKGLPAHYEIRSDFAKGNIALISGVICASASLLCFVAGSFVALFALR